MQIICSNKTLREQGNEKGAVLALRHMQGLGKFFGNLVWDVLHY
jgi:hypothetical protein